MDITVWIVVAVGVFMVLYVISIFNKLVRYRNATKEGWSGIDVQLRRRFDLIPNLVQTVKGYAAHEKAIFDEVAAKRASSINAGSVRDRAQAEGALSGALGRLFAVAEAYPDLKADANFRELQSQIAEIENQLQMARRYYNGTARELNNVVESFPSVVVAKTFGFAQAPYFELGDAAASAVPSVNF